MADSRRTLHLYYSSNNNSHICIDGANNSSTLYNSEIHTRQPNMLITSTNSPLSATVTYHSFQTRIDLTINNQPLTLDTTGHMHRKHHWSSPSTNGMNLTWQPQHSNWSHVIDINLIDGNGMRLANFHASHLTMNKTGQLDLFGPASVVGALMDEVVVTVMAIAQWKIRQAKNASVAAAVA